MPRYKLSPIERAAERERKDNLRNIMKGLDVKNFDDLKDVFKMMVGEMIENGLDGELDDELGYTKYDYRNKEGENNTHLYQTQTNSRQYGICSFCCRTDYQRRNCQGFNRNQIFYDRIKKNRRLGYGVLCFKLYKDCKE